MKKILSLALAFALGLSVASGIALATNWKDIPVAWSPFRVKTGAADIVKWGETYKLNGMDMPGSLVYNDTTYLPIRKITEATGLQIAWNGDSDTVTVFENGMSEVQAIKRLDVNGKEWFYNVLDAGTKGYLTITHQDTQHQRAYEMISSNSYRYDEVGVMFASFEKSHSEGASKSNPWAGYNLYNITKILFNSDKNSQDGNTVYTIKTPNTGVKITDLYFLNSNEVIYTTNEYKIVKHNLATGNSQDLYVAPAVTYSSGPGFSYGHGKLYITKFENNEITFVIERDAGEKGRKDVSSWKFDINSSESSLVQLW